MCKLWIPIIDLIFPIKWILQGQRVLKTIQLAREAVRKGLVFGFQSSLQPVTGTAGRGQWRSPRAIMLGRRGSADAGVGGRVRAERGGLGRPRASVAGGPAQPLARQPCQRPTWQVSLSGHCYPLGSRDLFNLGRIHPVRPLTIQSLPSPPLSLAASLRCGSSFSFFSTLSRPSLPLSDNLSPSLSLIWFCLLGLY